MMTTVSEKCCSNASPHNSHLWYLPPQGQTFKCPGSFSVAKNLSDAIDDYIGQLEQTLDEIAAMAEVVRKSASEMGCGVMQVQDITGRYLMMPIIEAKSRILPELVAAYRWRADR